ncbi:hypothetical protein B0H16DRAFT_1336110 [Mycena metata]|uniref:Transposase n=1 Tax=Mycena metata TaxID=1033252 RepID=A0AAD7MJE4_9AGAR|nr:hypothetical protein B0H16DRAFT_1336110 [Mycena metata]
MGTNQHISNDTKKLVIHLRENRGRKPAEISADLNICLSSVRKILRRYRLDNQGVYAQPTYRVMGRPQILQTADVDFLIALVERTPDIYLVEMQAELRDVCNVETSLLTIWRALRRRGFTRKRVRAQKVEYTAPV